MFRNCFVQSFIRLVVLIVLGDQCQRVTSDKNYGVHTWSDLGHDPKSIYDGSPSELESRHGVPDEGPVGGGDREEIVPKNSLDRNREHGRESGVVTGNDPVTDVEKKETRDRAPRSHVISRGTRNPDVPLRRIRRQMSEYYVDGPDGVIDRRSSYEGQYHVALGGKPSVAERRDDVKGAGGTTADAEEIGKKPNVLRPRVVNDDSGESEDVFFSEAREGQNREALDLFVERERSKRDAEPNSELIGQSSRHDYAISSIDDVPGDKEASVDRSLAGYKESGLTQSDSTHGGRTPSDHSSTEKAKLRDIVTSVLANEPVANYLARASRRSERVKRQILEYFVDSLNGRLDKRDTNTRHVSSAKDQMGKRRMSTAQEQLEAISRNAYENEERKQRGLDGRTSGEGGKAVRSVADDSDDLEDVVQNRARHRYDSSVYVNDIDWRRDADDTNARRRHNYVIGDGTAEADDATRNFEKRRLAYEEPQPAFQEDDFYYVEDQSNLVKRGTEQKDNEMLKVKDKVGDAEDLQKVQRSAAPPSDEDRKLLSKELVEIMLKEINDRLDGNPGNPDLQVRKPSFAATPEEETKNPELPKQNDSASVVNKTRLLITNQLRTKRRVSRSEPSDEIRRRAGKLEDDVDALVDAGKLGQRMKLGVDGSLDEKAEDLDLTKQIVAIVIEHAVRQLKGLASPGGAAAKQPEITGGEQPSGNPKSQDVVLPNQNEVGSQPKTTPLTYWDVDKIPSGKTPDKLVNTSDEYYAGDFHFQQAKYPSAANQSAQPNNNSTSQPKRRNRRQRLSDDIKSVVPSDDFSAVVAKTRTGQKVFSDVETAIFCRVIRRLADQGKVSRESYESLVSNKICFRYPAPYSRRVRRSFFQAWTPRPCPIGDDSYECSYMTLPPVDILTGNVVDPRCEDLTYVQTYPSVFNFYQGEVTTRIPLWVIHTYGGYAWGGLRSRVQPLSEGVKRNSVCGVLFAFVQPLRLWGLRFIVTPPTLDNILSIAVYLKHFNDTQNRWKPITEAGSKEPRIISATSALINFTDIHTVTGVLIFVQEWKGTPMLPHPVFISCSSESSLEAEDSSHLSITRSSSWNTILKAIAHDSKT